MMADFYQTGMVATLHRLRQNGAARLEKELDAISKRVGIALVLPALYREFESPSMPRIIEELAQIRYLRRIVLTLGNASQAEYKKVHGFFRGVHCPVNVLWMDGPSIQGLLELLKNKGLPVGENGKGRSCWMAYGYVLAKGDCDVIALHDCDIVNYDRRLLARLVYPVAHPNLGFEFSKGYYARVTDRMHGRVTRLFVTPLIRSMEDMALGAPFLRFIDSFRYPLAGEFAMDLNLARINRIPWDWGLEVGMLAEVFRNCSLARICQVDLVDTYDHKHQILSPKDPSKGLSRMACEIAKSLMRTLAAEGVIFTQDHFRNLEVRYVRMAEDTIDRYRADAMLNGLEFDRHAEELAVVTFADSLRQASRDFLESPSRFPLMPNWNLVEAAIPDVFDLLSDAVEPDNESIPSYSS
jgi:glucosyl-3-phosphoglycerate synthase